MQLVAPYSQRGYDKFYENQFQGQSVADYIQAIYDSTGNMEEFIDGAYEFIVENLHEIIETCG